MRLVSAPRFLGRARLLFLLASAIPFLVLTSGCGSSNGTQAVPTPTVTLSASPTSIGAGATVTLTATATNASKVTITGSDGSSYSLGASGGTQAVTPSATVTYTATAAAVSGTGTATATATVTVTGTAAPTVTIAAQPTTINAGQSSTLTVVATNATQVTISGSDGSSYTLATTGGTQAVSPAATTTYTATATGGGGTVTATATVTVSATGTAPTVTITANPSTVAPGGSSTLTVVATNATGVVVTGSDGSSYTLAGTGGTQAVSPAATTTYTATATGAGGTATATATVTVSTGNENEITHVIFMLQENHTFDNYFGMLNPYRQSNGWNIGADGNTYNIDGIDDKLSTITNKDDEGDVYSLFKLTSTCIDDATSAWLASFGDVSTYNRSVTRPIAMDGFVHNAEGFAKACNKNGNCDGAFTDTTGRRAMGYYDQGYLNYYYYMASQFALSDRWFSPVASKSVSNRLATFTGGTTQGLVWDPSADDHLGQLSIPTIFQELDQNKVSWKIYYTSTQGFCYANGQPCTSGGANENLPATWFSYFSYSSKYLYLNPSGAPCTGTTQPSSVVGDSSNSFCIDPNHVAPLSQYYTDLKNNTLPSFSFIESGSGLDDEHPGSTQSVLKGQSEVAQVVNSLMTSPSWSSSVFFLSYDEGGGPYEHVPPVPGHSNDFTDAADKALYPDIAPIVVAPDTYNPCVPAGGTPTLHCDLHAGDPGTDPTDVVAQQGFAAQIGFRLPNMVISPFVRKHYVSHIPMDHTAVIKFVENRFIGSSAHLTNRDAAQPNLLDFFDFTGIPWATPPSPPAPNSTTGTCTPANMGP